jgi:hypothetical protein
MTRSPEAHFKNSLLPRIALMTALAGVASGRASAQEEGAYQGLNQNQENAQQIRANQDPLERIANQVSEGMMPTVIRTLSRYLEIKSQLQTRMESTPKGPKLMDPSKYGLLEEEAKRLAGLLSNYGIDQPSSQLLMRLLGKNVPAAPKTPSRQPLVENEFIRGEFHEPEEVLDKPRVSTWDDPSLPSLEKAPALAGHPWENRVKELPEWLRGQKGIALVDLEGGKKQELHYPYVIVGKDKEGKEVSIPFVINSYPDSMAQNPDGVAYFTRLDITYKRKETPDGRDTMTFIYENSLGIGATYVLDITEKFHHKIIEMRSKDGTLMKDKAGQPLTFMLKATN